MIIEVPDDLSSLSPAQLRELEDKLDDARTAVRVEMRLPGSAPAAGDRYAGRPQWAQALGGVLDSKQFDRYVFLFAVLIVLFFTLPNVMTSFIAFSERYQASQYQGVPKGAPAAPPTLSDEPR